jgi:hypothetical protein
LLLVVADDGFPIGGRRNEKREEGKCGGLRKFGLK